MIKSILKSIVSYLYAILFILSLWWMMHIYIGENLVPSPFQTLYTFIELIRTDFYLHIVYSLYRILSAIVISLVIGIPLGMLIGLNTQIRSILSPIIYLIYPIPKIAFLPIIMVLFGIGDKSKIILMVMIILFQILIATRDSVLQIDKDIVLASKILDFNRLDFCIDVVLPSIAPKIFSAVRISVGIAISALFFSENYATEYGIGYFIMNSWAMVDYRAMFVGVVVLSLMALVIYKVIDILERILCPWE